MISYGEFISNYVADRLACPVAVANIDRIGGDICEALALKFDQPAGLIQDLEEEEDSLTFLMKIIRSNYL